MFEMGRVIMLNITHGNHPYCKKKNFFPIAAGGCRHDIVSDADGEDNISHKNRFYGDSTSIYWSWKNLSDVDYIGLSQYRRYLSTSTWLDNVIYDVRWWQFTLSRYRVKSLVKLLDKCDFVVPKLLPIKETVREQYIGSHPFPHNLNIVRNALQKLHPESVPYWDKYMEDSSVRFGFLFFTDWSNYCQLCEWLFPVLAEIETNLDISMFTGYQERVIAFLYERLVPVYYETYGKVLTEVPLLFIHENTGHSQLYYELRQMALHVFSKKESFR